MWPTRYDLSRLSPVSPQQAGQPRSCARSEALVRQCRLGAGPATRPVLQPWRAPHLEWPFGIFHLDDADAARRACLILDGTWELAERGTALARAALRLRVLAADAAWWRPLTPDGIWDTGVARSVSALASLRPRRATLAIVEGVPDPAGVRDLVAMERQAHRLPHALRVVLVHPGPAPGFARPIAA